MKKVLVSIVFAAMAGTVYAQPMDSTTRFDKSVATVLKQLDLSEQQKDEVRQLVKNSRDDRAIYCEDAIQFRRDMRELIQADTWAENDVRLSLQGQHRVKQDTAYTQALTRHNIWSLLDDSQKEQLNDIADKRRTRRIEKSEASPERIEFFQRFMPRLRLSEEQQSQMKELHTGFIEESSDYRKELSTFKQTERELIQSGSFAQSAWQDLYAQYQSVMLDLSLAKAFLRHQVLQILTEKQQKRLNTLQKKTKSKRGFR